MKEIGGYIELDELRGEEYHGDAVALNSGRHCLEYLIRAKGIEKIWLPDFLCDSVRDLCAKCGCQTAFYRIGRDFRPDVKTLPVQLETDEWLYIVNYYGQLGNEELLRWQSDFRRIIVDNAQAFFQRPVVGIDTLYTCRKYFGVSDGGYLYTEARLDEPLEQDRSYDRIRYVLGRYEVDAGSFYAESAANNKLFRTEPLKTMSRLTHNLLRGVDYAGIAAAREENFRHLHSRLGGMNGLELTVPEGPFMYPLYVNNGTALKKALIEQKVFVPTLWPDVFSVADAGSTACDLAENIVPLPCDQRYTAADMEAVCGMIFKHYEGDK